MKDNCRLCYDGKSGGWRIEFENQFAAELAMEFLEEIIEKRKQSAPWPEHDLMTHKERVKYYKEK